MKHVSITRPGLRAVAVLGLATVGLAGLRLVTPAQAAVPALAFTAAAPVPAASPATDPKQCEGDLCIQNIHQGVSTSTIKAWADTTGFTGHFELEYPDGHVRNSPNRYWKAGGSGYDFKNVPLGDGYQMIAWKGSKGHFKNIGQVGFGVG